MKRITSLLLVLAFLLAIPMAVSGEEDVITTITMFYPTSRSTNDYTNLVVEAVKEAIGVEMVVYAGSASEWISWHTWTLQRLQPTLSKACGMI